MTMDLYALLGLAPGATPADIKRAYRRLSRRYHPGINLETRILRPGRVPLQVQSVTDLDQRGVTLELICAETVGRHGGQTAY